MQEKSLGNRRKLKKKLIKNLNLNFREYSKTIKRPYDVKYDPFTQSLKILNEKTMIQEIGRQLQSDLNIMQAGLEKFQNLMLI